MKTSIALTTYNGRKYLEELLDSICNQSEKPDEVIIVDDCSSDGTYDYVNSYVKNNGLTGWNCFRNIQNRGWRANFREAFKHCTGDLIFLCDQDDIWEPFKIYEMKKAMEENPKIELLVSNYSVLNIDREEKVRVAGLDRDDGTIEQLEFKESSLTVMRPGCTFCARKRLIEQLWKRDDISQPHDAMLWGYSAINDTLYIYNKKTIKFRRHMQSASTPRTSICRTRRLEEIANEIELEVFFSEECKRRGYEFKEKQIEKQVLFNKRRKQILESKSLANMIEFQLKNYMHYPTIRNLLADDYVLLLKRR